MHTRIEMQRDWHLSEAVVVATPVMDVVYPVFKDTFGLQKEYFYVVSLDVDFSSSPPLPLC